MNLKEFSKKIGIPVSTISKALSNYKGVNINTKTKIINLAKKYNYSPNINAKTLASRITFTVGLVLPLTYSYEQKITFIDFIENIHSNLNSLNIPVIMLFAKNEKEEIDSFEKLINYHKVRLILLNDTKKFDKRIAFLDKKNVEYITWGRCHKNDDEYSWIDEDIKFSNELAFKFIISKGHTKIGYIDSDLKFNYFLLRKKFFIFSLKKNNIDFKKDYFVNGYRDNRLKTINNIKKLLCEHKEISVLLISSHTFASFAMEACRELKKEIGKDISLLSFDSNTYSSISPLLTVVKQEVNEINKNFKKIITSKINNLEKNFHYLYKTKLIDNNSVAKLGL